jgi:transposase InsO family protein
MQLHANAKLGPAGRVALVELIEQGMTFRAAAAALGVSPATAHRWWRRRQESGALANEARSAQPWWSDRSSRPHRQPRRLSAAQEEPILRARRETNLGPGRLVGIVRRARSTIWKVLWRNGLSRRPKGTRQTFRRYQWSRPGALLHVDMAELPRFRKPGHAVTGDHSKTGYGTRHPLGLVYLHCVVDDRSRYAYVEQHQAKDGATAAAVLARAIAHFAELGLAPPQAVMTDNAYAYTKSNAFTAVLRAAAARHITTPPYTPRWNGKVERFIRTLKTEWAQAQTWPTSTHRSRALASFVRYYNRRRPHSSLGDRPPLSVLNLYGQDS